MTVEADVSTDAALLYLSIDLGDDPALTSFRDQVDALLLLANHCDRVAVYAAATSSAQRQLVSLLDQQMGYAEIAKDLGMPVGSIGPTRNRILKRAAVSPARIRWTSLASPWVTVLGTLAETSRPIAYGTAGLFALQRLLTMIMNWQKHQVDLDRARLELAHQLASQAAGLTVSTAVVDAAQRLGPIQEAEIIYEDNPRAAQ